MPCGPIVSAVHKAICRAHSCHTLNTTRRDPSGIYMLRNFAGFLSTQCNVNSFHIFVLLWQSYCVLYTTCGVTASNLTELSVAHLLCSTRQYLRTVYQGVCDCPVYILLQFVTLQIDHLYPVTAVWIICVCTAYRWVCRDFPDLKLAVEKFVLNSFEPTRSVLQYTHPLANSV